MYTALSQLSHTWQSKWSYTNVHIIKMCVWSPVLGCSNSNNLMTCITMKVTHVKHFTSNFLYHMISPSNIFNTRKSDCIVCFGKWLDASLVPRLLHSREWLSGCWNFKIRVILYTQDSQKTSPSMLPVQGQWSFYGTRRVRIWGIVPSWATTSTVHLTTTWDTPCSKLSKHLPKVSPWLVLTPLQCTTAVLQL